jgi:hypothetical protein
LPSADFKNPAKTIVRNSPPYEILALIICFPPRVWGILHSFARRVIINMGRKWETVDYFWTRRP